MAYDEALAARVRLLLDDEPELTERKMFGGLAFFLSGHMTVVVSGQGGLMLRVDPAKADRLVTTTNAEFMVMRGREMRGWLRVADDDVRTTRALSTWVRRSVAVARALPPK